MRAHGQSARATPRSNDAVNYVSLGLARARTDAHTHTADGDERGSISAKPRRTARHRKAHLTGGPGRQFHAAGYTLLFFDAS
jgi:hypothetical protein